MSSSCGGSESFLTFKGLRCECTGGPFADIKITSSNKNGNKGRLRYVCKYQRCGWLDWVEPVGYVAGSGSSNMGWVTNEIERLANVVEGQRGRIKQLEEDKNMLHLIVVAMAFALILIIFLVLFK